MTKSYLFLLALCAVVLLPGCGNNASPKKVRLVFVGGSPDNYWSIVQLGCDFATRQFTDVDLDFRYLENGTTPAQQELLGALVTNGVDGIAISPIDPDSQTDFLNKIAASTVLVCADSDAPQSKRQCYIGADNVVAGTQAAELLKAALPQGGKIVLFISYTNAENTKDRIQGIQNGLVGSSIKIVATMVDGAASDIAQKNAEDALAKYPDLVGMACLNGYQGPAVLTAVRHAARAGQVKIVCFEDYSATMDGIASGDIYGTIVENPLRIGFQTIARMEKYLHGDKTQFADGKVFIPSQPITKANLADYLAVQRNVLLQTQARDR
ncbi:MAG TPA: substrate-binding domain-containing protein [Candidatus Acidoferrales bacterium]|nr:substrate-binding domain-containing protein [Candidatus Acidoferrales bacterium]